MKRYLMVLGVSAALLAGMAALASAEPYYQSYYPQPRSGVTVQVNLPLFGLFGQDGRRGDRDGRWYRDRDHGWQHGRGERGGDHYSRGQESSGGHGHQGGWR